MSFIGNIAAAQSAKAMGKYNQSLYEQQAKMEREKAERNYKVYQEAQRPQILSQQEQLRSINFVNRLKQGVEMRGTPTLVALKNRTTQMFDLAMSDYNAKTNRINEVNQSILLQAKGAGERFKGELTARTEYIKAGVSLLSMGQQSQKAGQLVIV